MKRSFLVLGLSVFAVFGSGVAGFPGSGGLCTLVLAFLAGLGWGTEKVTTYMCLSELPHLQESLHPPEVREMENLFFTSRIYRMRQKSPCIGTDHYFEYTINMFTSLFVNRQ